MCPTLVLSKKTILSAFLKRGSQGVLAGWLMGEKVLFIPNLPIFVVFFLKLGLEGLQSCFPQKNSEILGVLVPKLFLKV